MEVEEEIRKKVMEKAIKKKERERMRREFEFARN